MIIQIIISRLIIKTVLVNDPKRPGREQQGSVYTGNYWPLLNNLRSGDEIYHAVSHGNNAKCM
uniref:Uncharacterized protein n=1 Tax=Yersinia enterocolitica TaxID=630 RepID=B0RKN8_YEREN|nr:hypothetical protein [Yersinia enterocolitica]